jgi:hypothetical protein
MPTKAVRTPTITKRHFLSPPERWIAAAWLKRQQVVGGPKLAKWEALGPDGRWLALAGLADWSIGWLVTGAGVVIGADSGRDVSLGEAGIAMVVAGLPAITAGCVRIIQKPPRHAGVSAAAAERNDGRYLMRRIHAGPFARRTRSCFRATREDSSAVARRDRNRAGLPPLPCPRCGTWEFAA